MEVWKKAILVSLVFILMIFSLIIIFMQNGIIKLNIKNNQMIESADLNAKIKKENKNLYREVTRLKTDSEYLENVARKELGMIKDDEIIIRFHSENKNREVKQK